MGKIRMVIIVVFVVGTVVVGECLNNSSTDVTSSDTSSQFGMVFPDIVRFEGTLLIQRGNSIIENCSYKASINYVSLDANITRYVVYNPGSGSVVGNWHREKITIRNGSSFRVFVAPPATWMPPGENATKAIRVALYTYNPYYVLWSFMNSSIKVSGDGRYDVEIPGNVSSEILTAMHPGIKVPSGASLKGTVSIINGTIQYAKLSGCADALCYYIGLEVKADEG